MKIRTTTHTLAFAPLTLGLAALALAQTPAESPWSQDGAQPAAPPAPVRAPEAAASTTPPTPASAPRPAARAGASMAPFEPPAPLAPAGVRQVAALSARTAPPPPPAAGIGPLPAQAGAQDTRQLRELELLRQELNVLRAEREVLLRALERAKPAGPAGPAAPTAPGTPGTPVTLGALDGTKVDLDFFVGREERGEEVDVDFFVGRAERGEGQEQEQEQEDEDANGFRFHVFGGERGTPDEAAGGRLAEHDHRMLSGEATDSRGGRFEVRFFDDQEAASDGQATTLRAQVEAARSHADELRAEADAVRARAGVARAQGDAFVWREDPAQAPHEGQHVLWEFRSGGRDAQELEEHHVLRWEHELEGGSGSGHADEHDFEWHVFGDKDPGHEGQRALEEHLRGMVEHERAIDEQRSELERIVEQARRSALEAAMGQRAAEQLHREQQLVEHEVQLERLHEEERLSDREREEQERALAEHLRDVRELERSQQRAEQELERELARVRAQLEAAARPSAPQPRVFGWPQPAPSPAAPPAPEGSSSPWPQAPPRPQGQQPFGPGPAPTAPRSPHIEEIQIHTHNHIAPGSAGDPAHGEMLDLLFEIRDELRAIRGEVRELRSSVQADGRVGMLLNGADALQWTAAPDRASPSMRSTR